MAEHVAHPPRSERFIKAYLFVWGLLAAGGLTYLATLVWQPDWLSPPPRRPQLTAEAEPEFGAAHGKPRHRRGARCAPFGGRRAAQLG